MFVLSLVASAHMGAANVKSMSADNPVYEVQAVSLPTNLEAKTDLVPATVEDVVKDYFKDIPILTKVAQCESQFRQVDSTGDVLRGEANAFDVGVMQINEKYHLDRANKMGIDIYSLSGNLEYARDLYNKSGTAPWSASKPCWGASV